MSVTLTGTAVETDAEQSRCEQAVQSYQRYAESLGRFAQALADLRSRT